MQRCPECSHSVGHHAHACPQCGSIIALARKAEEEKLQSTAMGYLLMFVLAVFVVAWLWRHSKQIISFIISLCVILFAVLVLWLLGWLFILGIKWLWRRGSPQY
ncbi:hypothetical protein [Granulicella sp. L60]|uniref:hypothetical protein n=1 Tax=Granulicella sp. L60 TaxID=1641866 RepID=UPI00131BC70B|nr:hypothetical protein [Granulicella sp. L60]